MRERVTLFGALLVLLLFSLKLCASPVDAQRPTSVAILDFGNSAFARSVSETLSRSLKAEPTLAVLDQDQVRAASRGAGYTGSLNMSVTEARDLGSVAGGDFMIMGDAQTLRRSPSAGSPYFESYASLFLVSARTGKLVHWERPNTKAPTPDSAEKSLLTELAKANLPQRFVAMMRQTQTAEREERESTVDRNTPVIEVAPDDEKASEEQGLKLPKPFRRLIPAYPASAAEADAEATVDVLVDIDADGEVKRVEVARWGGFGLDQTTIETVRRLHFFPAMRDGAAIPIRVLLRYNFRKSPSQ
jgi:TonB family protein